MTDQGFESRFVSAEDGLRLHYRRYGDAGAAGIAVVCLPGLSRTCADFHVLATRLAASGRPVLSLDSRGRGLSAHDPDPTRYDLRVESADVVAVLAAAGVGRAIFVGTSRGGLITMILSAVRPALIAGAVLNDIGPVLEVEGLRRIRGYVGKLPLPRSWDEAVDILKRIAGEHFTGLSPAEWLDYARTTFREDGDHLAITYDPALMLNLQAMDLDALPTLWPQFDTLGRVPVLVVRGENSDLLSSATAQEMQRRLPDCQLHVVPGQGHAPLLADGPTVERILRFVAHCDPAP